MARVIDAHHHLWDLADGVPDWLDTAETRAIARPFGVADLADVTAATGVEATVLVQTVADEDETRAFLATAAGGPADNPIAAVTGWVDVTATDLDDAVAGLRAGTGGDLLRAIRYGVQDDPDPDALAHPALVAGVGRLGELGLGFEFLVRPRHLDGALVCARREPGHSVRARPRRQARHRERRLQRLGRPDHRAVGSGQRLLQVLRAGHRGGQRLEHRAPPSLLPTICSRASGRRG